MINLKDLVEVLKPEEVNGDWDTKITGISYDSREIDSGHLFVAIPGFEVDGHDFISEAIDKGAEALIVEKEIAPFDDIPVIRVADSRRALAEISAYFYDYPGQDLTIIGITGTNGKTTTSYLVETILREVGEKTGLIGTIKNKIGPQESEASRTTPESLDLQRYLARMRDNGITHVAMEVSSHALALERVRKIDFDRQVFTNLSQDHLEFHGSWEDYFTTKLELFRSNDKPAIVNLDDEQGAEVAKQAKGKVITYGLEKESDFKAQEIDVDFRGLNYTLQTDKKEIELDIKLGGKFNVYNSLAAVAVAASLGYPLSEIKPGIEAAKPVPGRFEMVEAGQDFGVIVDYAHSPDGMKNVLNTAQDLTSGQVIVVFGCGGDRDQDKRPIMGQLGIELADLAIVTSDNPRSEEPGAIIEDIKAGIEELSAEKGEDYIVIQNREEAIREGIKRAQAEDLVLIIGKGHETYQDFGDRVIDFDDREVAQSILQARSES